MTHSLSTFDADRPPAIYRSATLAMVVSSTSMNVGMTTAMATHQGLIAGRPAAVGAWATLLMRGLHRRGGRRRMNRGPFPCDPPSFKGRRGLRDEERSVLWPPGRRARSGPGGVYGAVARRL